MLKTKLGCILTRSWEAHFTDKLTAYSLKMYSCWWLLSWTITYPVILSTVAQMKLLNLPLWCNTHTNMKTHRVLPLELCTSKSLSLPADCPAHSAWTPSPLPSWLPDITYVFAQPHTAAHIQPDSAWFKSPWKFWSCNKTRVTPKARCCRDEIRRFSESKDVTQLRHLHTEALFTSN